MMETVTRDNLAGRPRLRLHGGRNFTKASVDLVTIEGRALVVKDLRGRPWPVRLLLGPWQLDREARAYRRLEGVHGIPRFLGRLDRQAILIEYIAGRDLSTCRPGELPESFFDRLDQVLREVHAAGVAHGDLHRHDVLQGDDGRPYLVDFSTSLLAGQRSGPLRRFLFTQWRRADLRSAAKLRSRLVPGSRSAVPPRPALYRAGARLKRVWNLVRGRGAAC
jgi:RIO1 family